MSDPIEYYDNISDRTVALLLEQFKTKENFVKFIEVLTNQLQELEYVFKDIDDLTWLDNSIGIQLDRLGDIIGYLRGTRNDEEYRNLLNFGIMLNRSAGEPEILISALMAFTGATEVDLYEIFPAACAAHINGSILVDNLAIRMDDLALGGVAFLYVSQTDLTPFGFETETSETDGLGFAWIDGGGQPSEDDAGEFAWALPE